MQPDFTAIAENFQFEGAFLDAQPYGTGHINDTYVALFCNSSGHVQRYLLQRINHHVFKDPDQVMQNIERVTQHLRTRIIAAGGDPDRETMTLIPTKDGNAFCHTNDGDYWRAFVFIEGAQTYEVVESLDHIYSATRAFGNFQQLLADFPAKQLYETIPDFHHTPKRFEAFVQAVENDDRNRAQSVKAEIKFVEKRSGETSILIDLLDRGKLPLRVTHNDTKFNNVLIDDATGKGVCVIDLDTVMPGLSLYDFGDAVRSGANTSLEDERDLSKVTIDLQALDRLAHGYLDATRNLLLSTEIDLLAFSARLLTFETGMRFLTDHLDGDRYFKIHRENHNLDRCRTQLKMVRDMEKQFEKMVKIIDRYR